MTNDVKIKQVHLIGDYMKGLTDLLLQVVEDGASIGFLPPLEMADAAAYWEGVLSPEVILYVARIEDEIVGAVQLHLCTKQNGQHRAEVAKLMTHPDHRQKGIARSLMQTVEERAKQEGRTLLVLDTREGDPSNHLYTSLGFIQAGRIPHFARSANGELNATILYYKEC
nr:GNAT family N-acetyltransferase [Brevibacillus dissolubilis]